MAGGSEEQQITQLIEAIHKLTVTTEQVAASLAEMLRKQEEDRAENKERQKKFDEESEEFRKRQKKWDEQDWWMRNPWVQPRELAYLLLTVALAITAITVGILSTR
jgi:ABC-type multidrug transport system fused ATPase/permease subunit